MNTIVLQQQPDGSFKEASLAKRIKFTPGTANRWYRLVVADNMISGELRVIADYNDRKTDIRVNVNATTTSRAHLSQVSHTVKGGENLSHEVQSSIGGGHVTWARVARRQGAGLNELVLDILCIVAGQELTIEGVGELFPDFLATPVMIGNGADEYNGIVGTDSESLANSLELGIGVRSNLELRHYHGHRADPQQPLNVSGRVAYLHALSLRGGAGKFTSATDHFHLAFAGGTASSAGFWTPQHYTTWASFAANRRNIWNNWQLQNANSSTNNEIFLGGVTEFLYGEGEITATKYGIDTQRIDETGTGNSTDPNNPNTNPGPPLYDGEVDFYFDTTFSITSNTYVTVTFPVGVAGIAAAQLAGRVIGNVTGPITAPDGATGKYKLTVRLEGLGSTEWYPSLQAFATTPTSWTIKTPTAAIPNQVSLTVHPTRRDKVIAAYSQPHNLTVGQNVVVNFLQRAFVVTPPGRANAVVSQVIDANTVEILLGTLRRLENANLMGVYTFNHNSGSTVKSNDSFSSDLYYVNAFPADHVTNGGALVHRVKLFSSGVLPTGLLSGTIYWLRVNQTYPHYFFKLYNSEADATAQQNPVQVQWKPAYGIHYLEFQDIQPLGASGWSIHIGNTDPGHQQTFGDAGWYMHRNIFPDNRGVAQGVITQGVYGGLNDVEWYRQKAFAYGWNCSAENDDTVAVGLNVKNKTAKSAEFGASDNLKLRSTENSVEIVHGEKTFKILSTLNNSTTISDDVAGHKQYSVTYYNDITYNIPGGSRSTWVTVAGGGPSGTTATIFLPRKAISITAYDDARDGDELYVQLRNIANRTVILKQYQFTGASYSGFTVPVPGSAGLSGDGTTYTSDTLLHLRMFNGNWISVPLTREINLALEGKENSLPTAASSAMFLNGNKTWITPSGAYGPMVLNRFRNLTFASSNYIPGANVGSTPSSFGFYTMTPFGNTLEGATFGAGTPRMFNPAVFFGAGSFYRIFAAVRTTSWFNDGIHCMIRSWDGNTQNTVPGLQDFGGGASSGDRIIWATSESLSSVDTWLNFGAYFAAYGDGNNSNGATIQDVVLTFYKQILT